MRTVRGMPYVTAYEMKELDRETIETCGIDVLSLMENAGTAVATVAMELLGDNFGEKKVACLAGKGNNGGDGLVAVRRLCNWGVAASVILAFPEADLGEIASRQLKPLREMGVPILHAEVELKGFDFLLDALLGYNSRGNPREPIAGLVRRANSSGIPVLAVDIPSGLDPTSGEPGDPCMVARTTLALGLPKMGFLNPRSRAHTGRILLGDVSIPGSVYRSLGLDSPVFRGGPVISLA